MIKLNEAIREYNDRLKRPVGYYVHFYRVKACLKARHKEKVTIAEYLRSLDDQGLATWFYENYGCHVYTNPEDSCPKYDSRQECTKCWLHFLQTKITKE